MENILTDEEKAYLRKVSNYLKSIGLDYGVISIDLESSDIESIEWNWVTHFQNNYRAEIPSGLKPILEKVMDYIINNVEYDEPDLDYLDYDYLEIEINATTKDLAFVRSFGYTEPMESEGTTWSEEDDEEEVKGIFNELSERKLDLSHILVLRYNGGGDSGYLESSFDDNQQVPAIVEDWCYSQLESNYGGWEINEGSQGYFEFNNETKEIILEHSYNENKNDTIELFNLNFSKK